MNILKLPTSGNSYRGKYPTRLRFISNGSREAWLMMEHFHMKAPHHLELNNGSRYIIDGFDLHAAMVLPTGTAGLFRIDFAELVQHAMPMTDAAYQAWLSDVLKLRRAWDSDHVLKLIHRRTHTCGHGFRNAITDEIDRYVKDYVRAVEIEA